MVLKGKKDMIDGIICQTTLKIIYSVELEKKLRKYGKAHDKYIPTEIINGSLRTIEAFIDAYTLGDGHIRVRDNGASEHTVFSVSAKLVDGMSEPCLVTGAAFATQLHAKQRKIENWLGITSEAGIII